MRLLFITQDFPPGIGGIQTYSAEHAARLSEWCEDFLLICPEDHQKGREKRSWNFDLRRVRIPANLLFLPLFRLLPRLLKKRSFDASFHSQWQTAAPAIRARKQGLLQDVFVAAHARELLYNPYRHLPLVGRWYEKKRASVLHQVDHFFPVSNFTAELLREMQVPEEKISIVMNGTDPEQFHPSDSSDLKKKLELENCFTIVTVTRLIKRKGIDIVLRAIASLKEEFPEIRYLIFGSGPEEKKLQYYTRKLGIRKQVRFMGSIVYKDLPDFYNLSDLFVLTSRTELPDVEGFGIVFLEANACGKPVIGSRSGGVPSAIRQGETGWIIEQNHPEELAKTIRKLLLDRPLGIQIGRNGRKRVLEELNWDALSRKLFNKMERLADIPSQPEEHTKHRTSLGGRYSLPDRDPLPLFKSRPGATTTAGSEAGSGIQTAAAREEKRLLMIAPYFLPRRRVGALRPFRFATHLTAFGWKPHVITIGSQGELTPREKERLQSIPVFEINPLFDRTGSSGSQLRSSKISSSPGKMPLLKNLADRVDRNFPLDTWLLLFIKNYRHLVRQAKQIRPEIIWSTGDPWSSHWLAGRMSRALEIPWIADFRDPWTLGGVQLRSRSPFSRMADRHYEKHILQQADLVTFTSGETRDLYSRHYPELSHRFHSITNSFDRSLVVKTTQPRLVFHKEHLNLIFFGRFRGLSPASSVIDILASIRQRFPGLEHKIRVYSFGALDPIDRQYAIEQGVLECFPLAEPIPPEEGPGLLSGADLLLLSTDPRRKHIIPAKLWDYLLSDRPILSVAPNPEIEQILMTSGAGVQFNPDQTEAVGGFLVRCLKAKQEKKPLPLSVTRSERKIEEYSAEKTTAQLDRLLRQILKSTS